MAGNDSHRSWGAGPIFASTPREPSNAAGQLHVSSFESEQEMEEHGGARASSAAAETRCVPHQGPLSLAEKSAQEWADEEIGSLPLLWDDEDSGEHTGPATRGGRDWLFAIRRRPPLEGCSRLPRRWA